MPAKILRNRAKCGWCKAVVESKFRRDNIVCPCGKTTVDGGTDYIRRTGTFWVELSEFESTKPFADKLPAPNTDSNIT